MRLQIQLTIVLLLLLVPPMALLSFDHYQSNVEFEFQNRRYSRDALLQASVTSLTNYLDRTLESIRADANIPQFYYYLENEQGNYTEVDINEILRGVIVKDAVFVTSAGLIDLQGNNKQDTNVLKKGNNESSQGYFTRQQNQQRPVITNNFADNGEPLGLTFSAPIRNSVGQWVGVIRLVVEPAKIQSILNRLSQSIDNHYRISIVDQLGLTIADSVYTSGIGHDHVDTGSDPRLTSQATLLQVPWNIIVTENEAHFEAPKRRLLQQWIWQLSFIIGFSILTSVVVAILLARPVKRLRHSAVRITKGDVDHRAEITGSVEFRQLAKAINEMTDQLVTSYRTLETEHEQLIQAQGQLTQLNEELEQRVNERTAELQEKNQALKKAMEQVVQSEKLASLGSLVAGISHELNTPIGVTLTGSTHLKELIKGIADSLEKKALTQSQLSSFIVAARESAELIESTSYKASELIASFKAVSVDQTSNRRRLFNINDTLLENQRTLLNMFKHTRHQIKIDAPDNVELDSYPGAFEQVMTNLTVNSLKHAFEGVDAGHISIQVKTIADKKVQIDYQDNGSGIPEDYCDRVFDPFFTTKMGKGGSGLGLYIVFNLVTGVLGGSIKLLVNDVAGVHFRLVIPLKAPTDTLASIQND